MTADLQSSLLWAAKMPDGNEDMDRGKNPITKLIFESHSGGIF